MKKLQKIMCWWFGCLPDFDARFNRDRSIYGDETPCKRCGDYDCSYSDMIGDTRHNRFKEWMLYWFLEKWVPSKCPDCGKRYGDHSDCLPF